MKFTKTIAILLPVIAISGCSFLDPLPDGSYNDDNYEENTKLLRGYVDKIYNDFIPTLYATNYLLGISAATDDAVYRSETAAWRKFSNGTALMSGNPFTSKWNSDYSAINYANLFLKDRVGISSRYLIDKEADAVYRRTMQGSAFGLRAWYGFDLLRTFAGKGTDGNMYGVPIMTEPAATDKIDNESIRRAGVDECVKQILEDCDSAYFYLPESNRDYPGDPAQSLTVTGSVRYKTLDRVCIDAIRAMVWLFWASPSFNSDGNVDRYGQAALYASRVMKHKIEREGSLTGGFDPLSGFRWYDCNSAEIVWPSNFSKATDTEKCCYPLGFGGQSNIVPTQELVDAFPMANGYPITDSRSGYDPQKPYDGRDPRFYAAIYYNGSSVLRLSNGAKMYSFKTETDGADAPGGTMTSPTGYYIRKFLYRGWNPYDQTVQQGYRCVHLLSWTQMCLIFAEAANEAVGPDDSGTYGYSAKQALAWLRARKTTEGADGLGTSGDAYLDECASSGKEQFAAFVRNEWRVETCFEGERYYNLRRWATSASDLNVPVHRVKITRGYSGEEVFDYNEVVENLSYPSLWAPLPYMEVRRCPNLVQNEGWESWK